uniref:Tumor necrosis factor alpha-induced protein 2 n=1 Tax=Spermophilus dauricus TaxID=99837 RepID=A0A8C9Q428_SPEDA
MSEASSEDLVPPPQAVVAPDQEQQEAAKKKKPTVLSNMFSIFTKGKKKRGQPSLVEPPLVPESKPGLDGPIPTGRLGLWLGLGPPAPASRGSPLQ